MISTAQADSTLDQQIQQTLQEHSGSDSNVVKKA
jgi:hypothetical protein